MKRRFLSILLSLCLVVGLLPTAAFAQGKSYVALGDSITAGYGLADGEKAFPEIVAEAKGYELTNLAVSGATSQDLLGVVQNSANTAVLANADLITITIGGNDLMGALYQFLADEYNSAKETNISATDVQFALEGKNQAILQTEMLTFAAGVISGFAASDAAEEALTNFGQNLNSIIAAIRTANPDVTIIVANQYNPYTFLAKDPLLAILGYSDKMQAVVDAFDAGLTQLNGAINQGEAMGMYSVAGVYEAFGGATQNPCNASVSMEAMSLNLDFHPNAYGHELIAGVINNLLPEGEEPGGDEEPQSPAESLYVNGVDILAAENHTVTCGGGTAEYDTAIAAYLKKQLESAE